MMNVMRRMYLWLKSLWRKKYDEFEEIEFRDLKMGDYVVAKWEGDLYELKIISVEHGNSKMAEFIDGGYRSYDKTLLYDFDVRKPKYYRKRSKLKTALLNL